MRRNEGGEKEQGRFRCPSLHWQTEVSRYEGRVDRCSGMLHRPDCTVLRAACTRLPITHADLSDIGRCVGIVRMDWRIGGVAL